MSKYQGYNSAVGTSAEDIITKGGVLTLPTEARLHNIVSTDEQDDYNGTLQVETATAAGTVAGVKQVETATVAGTIGASGAGNISVVVTGALVTGSPLTIPVAVSNNDTAAQVGVKIRTALNAETAITTDYVVSGASTSVILTAKVAAANDTSLNIATSTGTATGLTTVGTSANTTAGAVTGLTVSVVVTSAIVTGSPITLTVNATLGDTAALWAAKVRTALAANTDIADNFTITGSTTGIIMTAKTAAADDATLNIALDNGTSTGVTTVPASQSTTTGYAGTGAKVVEIFGVNERDREVSERVRMNGTTNVSTTIRYKAINAMRVVSYGSVAANAGTITATAVTDSTLTCQIYTGDNKSKYALYMNGTSSKKQVTAISVYCTNGGSAVTTLEFLIRNTGGGWTTEGTATVASGATFTDATVLPEIGPGEILKIRGTAASSTTAVTSYMTIT